MSDWLTVAGIGLVAGLAASGVMNAYQAATASLFGQSGQGGDPATVQAADDASKAATGRRLRGKTLKQRAGSAIHYATGAALGVGYAVLVACWPPAAWLFGIAFGLGVAIVLDDIVVPAFGWARGRGRRRSAHISMA